MRTHPFLALLLTALALLLAAPDTPAQSKAALAEQDVIKLVELGIEPAAVVRRIEKDGITFTADEAAIERLKKAGAGDELLAAVRKAGAARPAAASGAAGPAA